MRFVRDLVLALAAALVLTAALGVAWRLPRLSHRAVIWPFVMLFLAAWAGGVWLSPIGPPFFGGYVLPFFIVAFVVALVIGASAPPPSRRASASGAPTDDRAATPIIGLSAFLWIVVISLLAAVVAYYLMT